MMKPEPPDNALFVPASKAENSFSSLHRTKTARCEEYVTRAHKRLILHRCSQLSKSVLKYATEVAGTENSVAQTDGENFLTGRHFMMGSNSFTKATTDGERVGGGTVTPVARSEKASELSQWKKEDLPPK